MKRRYVLSCRDIELQFFRLCRFAFSSLASSFGIACLTSIFSKPVKMEIRIRAHSDCNDGGKPEVSVAQLGFHKLPLKRLEGVVQYRPQCQQSQKSQSRKARVALWLEVKFITQTQTKLARHEISPQVAQMEQLTERGRTPKKTGGSNACISCIIFRFISWYLAAVIGLLLPYKCIFSWASIMTIYPYPHASFNLNCLSSRCFYVEGRCHICCF